MRKLFVLLGLITLLLSLSACGGTTSSSDDFEDSIATLEAIGYVFEHRDSDAVTYYEGTYLVNTYSVNVDVLNVSVGYTDGSSNWLEIVELASTEDATTLKEAIEASASDGQYVIIIGTVVVNTYYEAASTALSE